MNPFSVAVYLHLRPIYGWLLDQLLNREYFSSSGRVLLARQRRLTLNEAVDVQENFV